MKNILKYVLILTAVFIVVFSIYAIFKKNSRNGIAADFNSTSSRNDILKVRDEDNIKGDKNAPITIIDYSDYQCPYCIRYDSTLNQVESAYPSQVRWVYRHFPLPFHQAAKGASVAAEAAGVQGKYWEFHDKIVANSQSDGRGIGKSDLINYATDLGLDLDKFKKDMEDKKIIGKVEYDAASGDALKIQGTPSSYLVDKNGNIEQLQGALTFDQLKIKIDAALAK